MQDESQGAFKRRLRKYLSEMERAQPLHAQGHRVSGGRCHLDAETFELLTRHFKRGKYSKGIMEGFVRVIGVTSSADLQRSSNAAKLLRSEKGGHIVQVSAFKNEMDEVKKAAALADLTVPALLEACTYLFVRVGLH
ncbi:hypothetical protein [Geothrix edaphica]|uniref:hypothetical protein n=1 Tax=Geothrix edaphica TaxID=2927976 RepID=UPI00255516EF|nr:hypothetical protein [Geothrix edaphica]